MFRLCVFGLLLFNKNTVYGLEEGESCTLESTGSQGQCTSLMKCNSAYDNLKQYHIIPQTCSIQGTTPIVCCPLSSSIPPIPTPPSSTPPPETPSTPPIPPSPTLPPPTSSSSSPTGSRVEGEISQQKCIEYGKYVYVKKRPPIPLLKVEEVVRDECGFKIVPLIVGGEKAARKEFPHMAIVGYELIPNQIKWSCAGSIISPQFILTAGHCLFSREFGDAKYVRVGITDLNSNKEVQKITISERIKHPDYHPSSHYHDIGLLKLERNINLNSYARPACLFTNPNVHTSKAIASGWGKTNDSTVTITQLMKVTLDLFSSDTCGDSYKSKFIRKLRNGIVDEFQICAGSLDKTKEKDTCQGDSGGPLQIFHDVQEVKCMYDIVGVTSFGKSECGIGYKPGVYTRVSNYIKWIEDLVWP